VTIRISSRSDSRMLPMGFAAGSGVLAAKRRDLHDGKPIK
jgi:hypothetical protein